MRCEWLQGSGSTYETTCGRELLLPYPGAKFCPSCGGEIEVTEDRPHHPTTKGVFMSEANCIFEFKGVCFHKSGPSPCVILNGQKECEFKKQITYTEEEKCQPQEYTKGSFHD